MRFFVLPIFDGVIMDGHPIFWAVDAGIAERAIHLLSSNGWAELWPEPMKFLVDILNYTHWLGINIIGYSIYLSDSTFTQFSCLFYF